MATSSDVAPQTSPPLTFPRFTHLPKELRLRIWEFSLPGPRIVDLKEYEIGTESYLQTSEPPPALLHACHEASLVARKHYRLLFNRSDRPSRVYFDASIDLLYINSRSFNSRYDIDEVSPIYDIPHLGAADMATVKRLALKAGSLSIPHPAEASIEGRAAFFPANWGSDEDHGEILWSLLFILRFFSGVEELNLIVDDDCALESRTTELALHEPIDISQAIEHYQYVLDIIHQDECIEENEEYENGKLDESEETLDMLHLQLQEVNEERAEAGRSLFTLPKVKMFSLIDGAKLWELTDLRERFYELIEESMAAGGPSALNYLGPFGGYPFEYGDSDESDDERGSGFDDDEESINGDPSDDGNTSPPSELEHENGEIDGDSGSGEERPEE